MDSPPILRHSNTGSPIPPPDPMRGNFYQTVWNAIDRITGGFGIPALMLILLLLAIPIARAIQNNHRTTPKP